MASSASLALPDDLRPAAAPLAVPASRLNISDWRGADTPDFRAAWDDLASRAAEPNPFFESWYLLPALRAHDPAGEVRLFCLHRGPSRRHRGWLSAGCSGCSGCDGCNGRSGCNARSGCNGLLLGFKAFVRHATS